MFTAKFALLAALTATSISSPFNGCVSASPQGKCLECYRRKVLLDGSGCGSLEPESDPCELYETSSAPFHPKKVANCIRCKPGHALKVIDQVTSFCIKGIIQDCVYEMHFKNGYVTCPSCRNGKYEVSGTGQNARISRCVTVSNPLSHCMNGGMYLNKQPQCSRCADGYTVDIQSIFASPCVRSSVTGCADRGNGRCLSCRYWEGYSMNQRGQCVKNA